MTNEVIKKFVFPTGQELSIVQGDITLENVEAIVNPANEHLRHGGGIAGAIVKRGGRSIQIESNKLNRRVKTGHAVITSAGKLSATYVIHVVGPIAGTDDFDKNLRNVVRSAILMALEYGITSISIPAISSGIFGGDNSVCTRIIISTLCEVFRDKSKAVMKVRCIAIDRETVDAFVESCYNLLT